ncbi:pyrroline-5-carboxylate reductase 3 [Adelges cooleyi]|uniref:pyrroline-5-carboxylate reductase 3 n=1 Tax=Adelges cooleyi TaxID=133065 RepID=UPI00217F5736|nr:pyrroline-5-carboxylate reductase 3 [Adelges cooleyi]
MLKIGFFGAGKMAQALAKGFVAAGLTKGELITASCALGDTQCIEAFEALGSTVTFDNRAVAENAQVVCLAVKPSVVKPVLDQARPAFGSQHLLLSVAMGVTVDQLEKNLPDGSRVMRVMPNTPALVQCGASVYVPGSKATEEDEKLTRKLLSSVGTAERVPEYLMDPITALSGSGPAYVYVIIEALADGAVRMGLPRDMAYRLASQTVLGAGTVVRDTGEHPGKLKDDVTSPAGSTAAGLYALERGRIRHTIISALEQATEKCRETSKNVS